MQFLNTYLGKIVNKTTIKNHTRISFYIPGKTKTTLNEKLTVKPFLMNLDKITFTKYFTKIEFLPAKKFAHPLVKFLMTCKDRS